MDISRNPLAQSLYIAGALDPYLNMLFRDHSQEGWSAANDLFIGNGARLKEIVTRYGYESWGTANNHVAASSFIIAYLTRVIYPVIGQYVLHRRVPKATLGNLAFHRVGERIDGTGLRRSHFAALANDPAKGARVTVNGNFARGRSFPRQRDGRTHSTCALAFSESWLLPY